jgi:uncharacterized protein involved in exopolysaccharide biosynthesis
MMKKVMPATQAPGGDEIDLLEYAGTWWRYRYVLVAVAVVVAAVTNAINRHITPTWETTFRLMGTATGLEDGTTSRLSIIAFRELVESPTQAAALIEEFGLAGPPHNLTPEKFLGGHVDVEVITDSTIIEVAVRLKDRDLLVKLARRYAEGVVETAQRINTEGIDYTAERIRKERDAALERLTGTERAVEDYQRRTQIELLRKDVDTMLERRPDALDLNVRIQGARARLKQAEAELAKQPRVREVRRGVDSVASTAPPGDPSKAPAPDIRISGALLDPYVNPVYEALSRDVSQYRTELAALEQERKELVGRLQLDAPTAARLTRLYEAESALETLARNRDIARDAYLSAARQYENARLQSTVRSPRLQILDAALPPDAPVGPRALRNTAAAVLIALTLAAIAVITFEASRRRREPA